MTFRRIIQRSMRVCAIAAIVGLATGISIGVATAPPGAQAAPTGSWGPDGTVVTDSAVSLSWSNTGNPSADTVAERSNPAATIAHAGSSTYADIPEKLRTAYAREFGSDNGRGGLRMAVSQTTDLVNQAVTVTFSGATPTPDVPLLRWMEVFQCWGSPGDTAPDPENCQTGVGGGENPNPNGRTLGADPLLANGDLAGLEQMPVKTIDGKTFPTANTPYFNASTTNELSEVPLGSASEVSRSFEMQTGQEAQGLGCGVRALSASTSLCWLVAVPVDSKVALDILQKEPHGLNPILWAQRLQVKLAFQPATADCPGGQAQTLSVGGEVLTPAMASWTPGICGSKKVAVGYSTVADDQARNAVSSASANLAFVTNPLGGSATPALYAPVAVGGVAIAYTLDYPSCAAAHPDIHQAMDICGYPDVASVLVDRARNGHPVTGLKLNARLVAKLLTQSYGVASAANLHALQANVPWLAGYNVTSASAPLLSDPEFLALNPGLKYALFNSGHLRQLTTEILKSDAAGQVWNWIVNDPGARAFLDGCPDPYGAVINPFYSTRTYAECTAQAASLETAAAALRHVTLSPEDFNKSQAPTYPPTDASYPTVLYAQEGAERIDFKDQGMGTMVDLLPQLADMKSVARSTFRVSPPTGRWCAQVTDLVQCLQPQWKAVQLANDGAGFRAAFGITDTVNAARFTLQTALLCNDSGSACVGADANSLTKAAASFPASAVPGVAAPLAKPGYASGAYPLAVPVYGVVTTTGLAASDAKAIADILDYATTTGQTPGLKPGSLVPGYAPLPRSMVIQTASVVSALRQVTDAAPSVVAPATATVPNTVFVPGAPVPPAPTPAATKPPLLAEGTKTASIEVGFPQFGIFAGLAAAIVAGLASPLLGRRRKVEKL